MRDWCWSINRHIHRHIHIEERDCVIADCTWLSLGVSCQVSRLGHPAPSMLVQLQVVMTCSKDSR